jgi:hypothetical protein
MLSAAIRGSGAGGLAAACCCCPGPCRLPPAAAGGRCLLRDGPGGRPCWLLCLWCCCCWLGGCCCKQHYMAGTGEGVKQARQFDCTNWHVGADTARSGVSQLNRPGSGPSAAQPCFHLYTATVQCCKDRLLTVSTVSAFACCQICAPLPPLAAVNQGDEAVLWEKALKQRGCAKRACPCVTAQP